MTKILRLLIVLITWVLIARVTQSILLALLVAFFGVQWAMGWVPVKGKP